MLLVSVELDEIRSLADRVLVMETGSMAADNTPQELLAGDGGDVAQGLVAVPRDQAEALAGLAR